MRHIKNYFYAIRPKLGNSLDGLFHWDSRELKGRETDYHTIA